MMEQEKIIKIPQGYKFYEERNGQIVLRLDENELKYPSEWYKCLDKLCDCDCEINYIGGFSEIIPFEVNPKDVYGYEQSNLHPAEYSKALLALTKLLICYKAWMGDYKFNWNDLSQNKYCIAIERGKVKVLVLTINDHILAFPTRELANKFLDNFEGIIKNASILL
jgi:hypothetical protein